MPFDAMVLDKRSLADHLQMLGITPVPMEVLEVHKAAQLRRYRPNLLVQPLTYVVVFACIFAALLASQPTVTMVVPYMMFAMCLTFLAFMVTSMVIIICKIKIFGKAEWRESTGMRLGVPSSIRKLALRVNYDLPVKVVYGELIRHEVVLDPYIVIELGDERACLGIWDNDTIIACAESM